MNGLEKKVFRTVEQQESTAKGTLERLREFISRRFRCQRSKAFFTTNKTLKKCGSV
jgi:hypothetical protein